MLRPIALVAACALLTACGASPTRLEDISATRITLPGGRKIMAETMRKDNDMVRGMMFRDALPPNRGMLFVHPKPGRFPYWMYNCKVPLDILWLDRNQRIVEISANTPPCTSTSAQECPTFGGAVEALYVLELNGGQAAKWELRLGDVLTF